MALNSKILIAIAGSLLGLAFIFFVVSNAVPEWGKVSTEGAKSTIGLWRSCYTVTGSDRKCEDIKCPQKDDTTKICSKILAARAFVTLACIMSGICALLLFGSAATSDNTRRLLLMVAKGLAFACLIVGIIGVAIGINGATETGTATKLQWGAAAIIGVIAIVLNFCGAVASVLIE